MPHNFSTLIIFLLNMNRPQKNKLFRVASPFPHVNPPHQTPILTSLWTMRGMCLATPSPHLCDTLIFQILTPLDTQLDRNHWHPDPIIYLPFLGILPQVWKTHKWFTRQEFLAFEVLGLGFQQLWLWEELDGLMGLGLSRCCHSSHRLVTCLVCAQKQGEAGRSFLL